MKVLLRVLAVYMAAGPHMTQVDTAFISDIECVAESVTNGSSWECGFCLDIEQQGKKKTIMGLKRDNETNCQGWNVKGRYVSGIKCYCLHHRKYFKILISNNVSSKIPTNAWYVFLQIPRVTA